MKDEQNQLPVIYSVEETAETSEKKEEAADLGQTSKKIKKRKIKRPKNILLVFLCVLLSGLAGFGGGYLEDEFSEDSTVIYQSVDRISTTVDGETTDDVMTTEEIAEAASDSVVEITTEGIVEGAFMQEAIQEGAGSGVIISEDGYIITNNHVIDGMDKITVTTSDETSYEATVVGTDSQTDIALLKIDATDLQPAVLGDSSEIEVGEDVVAIGNPLGTLGGTVTEGIISALNRSITIDNETMNLLQTSAAINPGNSGGGLFNAYGELIGIVNAKTSGDEIEGLGFAIPINDVKEVIESLKTNGYVTGRAYLGVSLVDIDSAETAMQYNVSETGIYLAEVEEDGAADQAGLEAGDRLISIDSTEADTISTVKSVVEDNEVGDTIDLEVMRDGKTQTFSVTLGEAE